MAQKMPDMEASLGISQSSNKANNATRLGWQSEPEPYPNAYQLLQKNNLCAITRENGKKEEIALPDLEFKAKFGNDCLINAGFMLTGNGAGLEMGSPGKKQKGGSANESGARHFELDDNLGQYCTSVGYESTRLMMEGDFRAASELLLQAMKILQMATEKANGDLQLSVPGVSDAISAKIQETGSDLQALYSVSRLVLSTYSADDSISDRPFLDYQNLPGARLAEIMGVGTYASIGFYLSDFEKTRAPQPFMYSSIVSTGRKEQFLAAEKGMDDLKHDIEWARRCGADGLEWISEKWGLETDSRFEILNRLVTMHVAAGQYYQSASLVDIGEAGLNGALGKLPGYNELSVDDKALLKLQYQRMIKAAKAGLEGQMAPLSAYAFSAGENPSDYKLLSDPCSFGLVKALSNSTAEKPWPAEQSRYAHDVVLLRNLEDISKYKEAFSGAGKILPENSILRTVEGLCIQAFRKEVKEGDMIAVQFKDAWHLRENFKEQLAGRYGAATRELQNSEAWKGIKAAFIDQSATLGDFADASQVLFSNFGKTGLLLGSVACNFSKNPIAKVASKAMMYSIAAWDAYDGNYAGSATLLLGMHGAAIPLVGRGAQTLAVAKMTFDGIRGAFDARSAAGKYGAGPTEIFDGINSVLIGILLPSYHGYKSAKEFNTSMENIKSALNSIRLMEKKEPQMQPVVQMSFIPGFNFGGKGGTKFPEKITPQKGVDCIPNALYYALTWLGYKGEKETFIKTFKGKTTSSEDMLPGIRDMGKVDLFIAENADFGKNYALKYPIKSDEVIFKTQEEAVPTVTRMLESLKEGAGSTAMILVDMSQRGQVLYGYPHATMIFSAFDASGQVKLYEVNTYGTKKNSIKTEPVEITEQEIRHRIIVEVKKSDVKIKPNSKIVLSKTNNIDAGNSNYFTVDPRSVLFITKKTGSVDEPVDAPGVKIKKNTPQKQEIEIQNLQNLGLIVNSKGDFYTIIDEISKQEIASIKGSDLPQFTSFIEKYRSLYPNFEGRHGVCSSLEGFSKNYNEWAKQYSGGSVTDFLIFLSENNLSHHLAAKINDVSQHLKIDFGVEYDFSRPALRYSGTAAVYQIPITTGESIFIKFANMAEEEAAVRIFSLLGKDPGYSIKDYGNFGLMTSAKGITIDQLFIAEKYGSLLLSDLDAGGDPLLRSNFLSSIAGWLSVQMICELADSHPRNYTVQPDGLVTRIDYGDFGRDTPNYLSAVDLHFDFGFGGKTASMVDWENVESSFKISWRKATENFEINKEAIKDICGQYSEQNGGPLRNDFFQILSNNLMKDVDQAWIEFSALTWEKYNR